MLTNNAFNTAADFECGCMYHNTIDLNCNFFCFAAKWGKSQVGSIYLFLPNEHVVLTPLHKNPQSSGGGERCKNK